MDDVYNLVEASQLLGQSTRDVVRSVESGQLPGRMRQGHWEFRRQDLRAHLQEAIAGYSDKRLAEVDQQLSELAGLSEHQILTPLIHHDAMSLSMAGSSKAAVLRELVDLGDGLGLVWDRPALLAAIEERERLSSTGVGEGVAIPHPSSLLPYTVAESFVTFGRTLRPIPFGSIDGSMVDLFFLVCSTDESLHLHVLARLCRLLRDAETPAFLREAESADDVFDYLREAELRITG